MKSYLDKEFTDAFDKISGLKENLAPDVMLKFYENKKLRKF